ncbi:uncharacterized protein [Epargyreus clarus]|uniref:uncharacterized protein n=1 Tax=Epargyreus clarus TaxID=520877 RepID=UPI003C2DF8FD
MQAYAVIFGVLAACAVVIQASKSGPLLTALQPVEPQLQLNRLERQKRTLPIVDNVLRGVGETLAGVGHGLFGSRVAPAPLVVPGYYNYAYPNSVYVPSPPLPVFGPGFFGPGHGGPGFGNGFFPPNGNIGPGHGSYGPNNGNYDPNNGNYGPSNGNYGPNNGQRRSGTRYYGPGNGNYGPVNGPNQGPGNNPTSYEDYEDNTNNEGSGAGCRFTYRSGGNTNC